MSRRYSRIREGARLNTALTNYIQYLQTLGTRDPQLNSQGARGATQQVFWHPFGILFTATEVYPSRVNPASYTLLAPYINGAGTGASVANVLGGDALVEEKGARPARVVWFRNATRAVAVARSEVTNMQYLKYNGDRDSCPFGANTEADNEIDAFNQIKGAILEATANNEINRVSLQRERMPL